MRRYQHILRGFGNVTASTLLPCRPPLVIRRMSTRQAERLRRHAASSADSTATARGRPAAPKGGHASSRDSPSQRRRDYSKLNSSGSSSGASSTGAKASSTAKKPAAAAASSAASARSSKRPPLQGRFNRLVIERGFFFTVYLYVLGESITLGVAYLLHTHRLLGIGDVGSWLAALHFPTDRYLNVGPTVYGLQLSPRLLLNYVAANVVTYPLLPLQVRWCGATAPLLQAPFRWVSRAIKKEKPVVPKAPPAKP